SLMAFNAASAWPVACNACATVALRAQALQATGQADAALKAINEALPFSPTDYNLLMTRARLLDSQNKAAEAVLAWRRLTELRPGEPAIWQALGRDRKSTRLNSSYV